MRDKEINIIGDGCAALSLARLIRNLPNYKLNLLSSKNPYRIGTRICLNRYLNSPQWLRELKFKRRPLWRVD